MRSIVLLLTILMFSGSVFAECKDKLCMTNESEFQEEGGNLHTFHYNKIFEIGTNWYLIFDYPSGKTNDTISFEFSTGLAKTHIYDPDKETDSVSFSGSSFAEEEFDFPLYITVTGPEGVDGEFIIYIHINKPPADDLFYLWGGMSVFWFAIGAYVLYLSTKLSDLSKKVKNQ